MSHYTLTSGIHTETHTSRCPVCLKVTYHSAPNIHLTDETVCCPDHRDQYIPKLWELWHRAQTWGQDNNISGDSTEIFNTYMIHIGL